MRVAYCSAEVAPFSKTGGLGDVAGSLPAALDEDVAVFTPLYRGISRLRATDLPHWKTARREGIDHYFFDAPELWDRDSLYGSNEAAFEDNEHRFRRLCEAIVADAGRLMGGEPDVFHVNDWHTALVPALTTTRTVLSIHNLAYQGAFDSVNFLRTGIEAADCVTTVSPGYAEEIQSPEHGMGLDDVLRRRGVSGIVNGLVGWAPPYSTPRGKKRHQKALRRQLGLSEGPLLAVVSRFTWQKGLDLVADAVPALLALGTRLVVLGTGDPSLEQRFESMARQFPEHLYVRIDFDEVFARQILAGADLFLMPSRFEPCGLTQLQAMAFGTLPVVRAVGGLKDTVDEGRTGFVFRSDSEFVPTLQRALAKRSARMQRAAMARDSSWAAAAAAYSQLYQE